MMPESPPAERKTVQKQSMVISLLPQAKQLLRIEQLR
jgi:hypothetical protein